MSIDLWDYIATKANSSLPWCLLGDFNPTLSASEKFSFHPSRFVKDFQLMMLSSSIQDMGFSGNNFTWSNNRRGTTYIAAKLDRAICNPHWYSVFSDHQLSHLPKYSSDHCPLLLSHNQRLLLANVHFKFESMRIQHPDLKKLVADRWSSELEGHSQYVFAQN